jgi:type IV pilus assembly protein PilM
MRSSSRQAKPRLACEITSQNVIAARAKADGSALEVHTIRKLGGGGVRPSLNPGNIADIGALSESIGGALSAVGGRKRDVVAVIPDASVRVLLMDFDALPEKMSEAEPIVRFRLRKSVPFDAELAALSFQTYRKANAVRVLATITPREVRDEYESAFRTAGFEPGYMVPSTIAVLAAIEADRPTLLVKSEGNSISIAIADQNELVFYRMLDSTAARSGTALADEVYPSVVFFEDNYSAKIERILLSTSTGTDELKQALEEQTGVRAGALEPGIYVGESLSGDGLPSSALAGVAGVLTQ